MKSKEFFITIAFGLLSVITWIFPSVDFLYKIIVSIIVFTSIFIIHFKDRLTFFIRKYWQEIIAICMLIVVLIVFVNAYRNLFVPLSIVLITSISISLLISLKYSQSVIYKAKELVLSIPINSVWRLNHWGSTCASISAGKMIFAGTTAPEGTDGCNIDYIDFLEIGKTYEISCLAKSEPGTEGKLQLWCHDKTGEINGVSKATPYKTPSIKGEQIRLIFKAEFNRNIRVHLQYEPGVGRIEVNDVKIYKLKV